MTTPYIWAAEIEVVGPDGATTWLRVADTPMRPFRHDDGARPNTRFEPRLVEVPNYETGFSVDPTSGGGGGAGTLTLSNADGALTPHRRHAWRRVVVKRGWEGLAWDDWTPVVDGVAGPIDPRLAAASPGRVAIPIWDRRAALDGDLVTAKYAGTGDLEGPVDVTGRPKPLGLGDLTNANVTPVWLSTSPQIAQLTAGPMGSVTRLDDRGDAMGLISDGDLTGGAFDAAPPAAGHMVTDQARGLIKINANPGGVITAGFSGLAAAGTTWTSVAAWLLAGAGQSVASSLAAITSPATIAMMVGDGQSTADVLGWLCRSGGGWVAPDATGLWRAGVIALPSGDVVMSFGVRNIVDIAIDDATLCRPVHAVTVTGVINHTPMGRSEIANTLWGGGREAILRDATRQITASDPTVKARFGEAARAITIDTALATTGAMEALAARLLTVLGVRGDGSPPLSLRVVVPMTPAALALTPGDEVAITYPKEGISGAFLIYGIIPAAPSRHLMTLRVFQ